MSDTYLVTGGSGFIGSHIVRDLLAQGHKVRILDNFATGRRSNLSGLWDDIELIEGDLRSYERVHVACAGADRVLHLGALPSVPRSVQDPLTSNAVNVTGTLNVLLAGRDKGVGRVVFASSSSIYGQTPTLPKIETMSPAPMSPYGVSKLAAEQYLVASGALYGVECVALRLFNVFGPRQDPNSQYSAVVPRFITAALAGDAPVIFGDGSSSRDFTYVGNVVDAFMLAARVPEAAGEVMNIACGGQHTLKALVNEVARSVGTEVAPVFETSRAGDIPHSFADISKAEKVLGFTPRVGFSEGIDRTVAWIRDEERAS
jgi:UDP-glucose 4-epimerase